MGTPINLNKHRKAKARAEQKAQADANAVRFGWTKAERMLDAAREEKTATFLDQHKFDDE